MRTITESPMGYQRKLWLFEMVCMTFSATCYLICAMIGMKCRYLPAAVITAVMAMICAGRVAYLLRRYPVSQNSVDKAAAKTLQDRYNPVDLSAFHVSRPHEQGEKLEARKG